MKKHKEFLVAMVVVLSFSIGILFSGASTLYAVEKPPGAQQINIKQLQAARTASKIPPQRNKTLDLMCEIKAFYDKARTKPISGGVYDARTALYSQSPYIYYDIIVDNTGDPGKLSMKTQTAKQASTRDTRTSSQKLVVAMIFDVKITFKRPDQGYLPYFPKFVYNTFTESVINLGPGESHVFSFYGPPPTSGEFVEVGVDVDPDNKVKEDYENNNYCSYKVSR